MRHFLTTADWSRTELQGLLDRAQAFKDGATSRALEGKSIALMFFNPSLRTRSSFDIGAYQLGGHAIVLDAKGATWPLEFADGAVMDGTEEEHVREAARVLSSFVDIIAIRCFPDIPKLALSQFFRVFRCFEYPDHFCFGYPLLAINSKVKRQK